MALGPSSAGESASSSSLLVWDYKENVCFGRASTNCMKNTNRISTYSIKSWSRERRTALSCLFKVDYNLPFFRWGILGTLRLSLSAGLGTVRASPGRAEQVTVQGKVWVCLLFCCCRTSAIKLRQTCCIVLIQLLSVFTVVFNCEVILSDPKGSKKCDSI